MDRDMRKAAAAAYRERKVSAGIYVLHGPRPGQVWVGQAPNLASVENRVLFALRAGGHPCRTLQDAWNAGPWTLRVEVVDRLDAEAHPSSRNRVLQEKLATWAAALGAERV